MAKNRNNDLTKGHTGRIGDMISFRIVDGQSEAFRRPGKRKGPGTAEQIVFRERFFDATLYAKAVIADPIRKAIYAAKKIGRNSAYRLAVTDYLTPPEIRKVTTVAYHGQPGDSIAIRAYDDFKLVSVKVTIRNAAGVVLEEGGAVALPDSPDWIYTAMTLNPQLAGTKLTIAASDLAENVTTKEIVL